MEPDLQSLKPVMKLGFSYHCGNCDHVATELAKGRCPCCYSSSVIPSSWYQLSVEERTQWLDRIQGRGVKPLAQHQLMARSTPVRDLDAEEARKRLWPRLGAWLKSFLHLATARVEAAEVVEAPLPTIRIERPRSPRLIRYAQSNRRRARRACGQPRHVRKAVSRRRRTSIRPSAFTSAGARLGNELTRNRDTPRSGPGPPATR